MINDIVAKLKAASDAYYNTGDAIMTDSEFDDLRDKLKSIDPNNPYFSEIGHPIHRNEVKLIMHMGSQNKAKDESEFKAWYDKYNQPEIIISDKLDGSSVEAVYESGKLVRVATRGDGITGMDVTRNAMLWSGLPHNIEVKGQLVVRGEAQLSVTNWKKEFSDKANPRNAGNGIVVCDSEGERNKHIDFHAFDLVHPEVSFKKQSHKFKALKALGFAVVRWFRCDNWDDIVKCRGHYEKDRPSLDFEIDGMIAGIEDLEVQEKLGYSDGGSRPRGQIAWKFETDKGETEVLAITLSIGHTGKIIPTATLKQVRLAGTNVTHCLLNNFDYIAERNINIGDIVEVEKGGDIIPHITKVVKKNSNGPYLPPKDWKGYDLIKEGADWKVVDEDCPDLNFQRIKNWINKTNIKQLGDNALLAMVESGMVNDIDDLYKLDESKVAALQVGNGVIGSNAKKIIDEINKTRSMTIDLFIGSLSIKHLGRSRAALLIPHGFDNVAYYLNVDASNFVGKPCSDTGTYGTDVASEIHGSLAKRRETISRLIEHITIEQAKAKNTNGPLSGKTFCFSGVRLKGDDADKLVQLGGEDIGKVNKDLTYLVVKDPSSNSSKVQKANSLGVKVISLEEFESIINS